ncbi:MAG: hypothetical protein K2M31_00090 [Muribaculaceae bacterium]|nr:hypothetical protein [Muribaculaceae bacterium]
MKRIVFLLSVIMAAFSAGAEESDLGAQVVLTPYVVHDASTPTADQILLDKLNRIVTKYGVGSQNGLQSPFIITGHAIELNKEVTATAPPHTAVELSLTLYIGNGEEGTKFSTCNMTLKGVGNTLDKAYAAAFRKINVNDPELENAIDIGRDRIKKYYETQGPGLIRKAEAYAAAGNYSEAYGVLLRIPPVCPQYAQAQKMVIDLVGKESDDKNGAVIRRARAAWSASPNEYGASEAQSILAGMYNPSQKMRAEADALMKEMSARLQKVDDDERAAEQRREADAHNERMAYINGATKVAVAQAKQPVYHIHWW